MALIRCDFMSDVLEMGASMTVLLPQDSDEQVGATTVARSGPPPVLYLLHGLSDDDTAWLRFTSIERYAAAHGLAVVMPQVDRSFYTDLPNGHGDYWQFLSEELPAVVSDFFRVSERREDTFVAGLSMGGFGALKWALDQPERFAAAASLSGALDLEQLVAGGERDALFATVLGDRSVTEAGNDLFAAAEALEPTAAPRFFVACGTEDLGLLPSSRRMAGHLQALGLDVTASFSPVSTSGATGTPGSRTCWPGSPSRPCLPISRTAARRPARPRAASSGRVRSARIHRWPPS